MNGWFIGLGTILNVLTIHDAVRTTMSNTGAGIFSGPVTSSLWKIALGIHHRKKSDGRTILRAVGPLTTVAVPMVWVVMLWTGWFLLFSSDVGLVYESESKAPAGIYSRIYFTGYTLFTLGIGNFVPRDGVWELLTALASLNGFFIITLAVTYLMPVASASTQARQLAGSIASLGRTPTEIVLNSWDGKGFSTLTTPLQQLLPMVELHAHRHLMYPTLHYYHSSERRTSISLSLTSLVETLLLLEKGVAPAARLPESVTAPLRRTLSSFLGTMHGFYLSKSDEAPRLPVLADLAAGGIPVVEQALFSHAATEYARDRRLSRAYVQSEGWRWEDVYHPKE